LDDVHVNTTVLGYSLAISLLTGVICGLAPALRVFDFNLSLALKEGNQQLTTKARRNLAGAALVVAQIALSMILLTGAGLTINSFIRLLRVDPGFNTEGVMTFGIPLSTDRYPKAQQQTAFFREILQRVEHLPGAQVAGMVSHLPLSGGLYAGGFMIEGPTAAPPNEMAVADRRIVSPNYFATLGIPLVKGRDFTAQDNEGAPGVIIISESWMLRFMPNEDPIGRRVKLGGKDSNRPWLSIVGVVGDVRHMALDVDATPHLYVPYPQFPASSMTLVVKTAASPASLTSAVSNEIRAVESEQLINPIKSLESDLSDSVSRRRFSALLLGVFAVVAVVVTVVGVYGVISHLVGQRTHEIGVRIMLGAQNSDILKLAVGQGLSLILIGIGAGLIGAYALTRITSLLLYRVRAADPLTFALTALLLALIALLACWIPARRATKVDPMAALRSE
jgi:putative ABC transport system permease protein